MPSIRGLAVKVCILATCHRVYGCALLPSIRQAVGDPTAHWIYAHKAGEASDADAQSATWGAASPTCVEGYAQSPIDIVTADVAPAGVLEDALSLAPLAGIEFIPKHSGHAFQIDVVPGQTKLSTIGSLDYTFVQAHWHTPSESMSCGIPTLTFAARL